MVIKSGVMTITRSQLEQLKLKIFDEAIAELQKREQEVINVLSDDNLRMVMTASINALFKMDCEYEFVSEFIDFVGDIVKMVNDGVLTLEELEAENAKFGLELVKESGSDMPKELLIG